MATELDELIIYWRDHLLAYGSIFYDQMKDKIRATIKQLEELKELKNERD